MFRMILPHHLVASLILQSHTRLKNLYDTTTEWTCAFLFLILPHRLVASLILQPPPSCLIDSSTTALLPL